MPIFEYTEVDPTGIGGQIKWYSKLPEGQATLERCPHCGSDEFYRKVTFAGRSEVNYRFDGMTTDNSTLHDGVIYREGKSVYCRGCGEKLGAVKSK